MGHGMQRGFSLISAIFLLVVLVALGAAMVSFSTSQSQSQALDVLGSRAYQAAHAGVEWAAYNIAQNPGVAGAAKFGPVSGNALGGNLASFEVSVAYTALAQSDAVVAGSLVENVWTHDITASAVYGTAGSVDYVERVINAKM